MSLNKSLLADIQKKMSKPSKPKVPRNQWQHPGEITNIPSNNITMQGVGFPVMGIPNVGHPQMMQSGQDYTFPGATNVTEVPMMAYGGHGGLDRWFAEEWVDVKTGKPCGRQEGESRKGYPACRPSKRINDDTPKTSGELSGAEKEKFKREKTSSDRINYQHRRREFGGEEMQSNMEDFKSGGNVPTNPSLWSRAKSMARQKYDVYPSAYANGWASKWYKSHGGGWRKAEYGMEVEMQKGGSLYDYMAARGMDADFGSRKKVFDKFFANNYKGTAQQNQQMLAMLQNQEKPNVNINYSSPALQAAMPAFVPSTQSKAIAKGMQRVNNKVDNRNWFERTLGLNEDDVQEQSFDLPQDVYSYYNQYAPKNKGKKFGIVSKQNARGYFFDENGNLALQDEVGLGKDAGDEQPVFYKKMTTPSGAYTMNRAAKGNTSATDYGANYGSDNFFYIQHTDPNKRLIPDPANPNKKVSAALHGIPTHLLGDREKLFDNGKVSDNRMSAGCINCRKKTLDNPYFNNVGANTYLYVTPEKAYGGGTDNPGFRALPEAVQQKIMDNMAYGGAAQQAAIAIAMKAAGKKPKAQYADGGKMPEEIARARFAAAGNLDQMSDYGYAYGGGYMPHMGHGGQPDGEMALTQINAMMDKLDGLRKFIKPDTELEPWQASKLTLMDDFAGSVYDNMMYSPEGEEMNEEEMEKMANGGIPQRYKNMGFTHVGQKKDGDGQHKWKVLAKKGDKYKVVQGGYRGMQDFSQHHNKQRQENFWNRMGGKDSAKANDPFSPLYWHKRLGKWADGGDMSEMQVGGALLMKENYINQNAPRKSMSDYTDRSGDAFVLSDRGANIMEQQAQQNMRTQRFQAANPNVNQDSLRAALVQKYGMVKDGDFFPNDLYMNTGSRYIQPTPPATNAVVSNTARGAINYAHGGATYDNGVFYRQGGMPCFECGGYMKDGGQYAVGDEMEVSAAQLKELKRQGYTFEIL